MFEKARRTDLLMKKQDTRLTAPIIPSSNLTNIDCLTGRLGKEPSPPRKARSFPAAKSFNPLRPSSGEVPKNPHKFTILPPISQIHFFSCQTPSDDYPTKSDKFPISNVRCLNVDESKSRYEVFTDILPSGRVAKKDYGIKSTDSEFVKLCKMNGRTNLLKEQENWNKSKAGGPSRNFRLTQRRTILRSPDENWIPSAWVKFEVYGRPQLRWLAN